MINPNSSMMLTAYSLLGNDLAQTDKLQSRSLDYPVKPAAYTQPGLRVANLIVTKSDVIGQNQSDAFTESSLILQLANVYESSKMADNITEQITKIIQKMNDRLSESADLVVPANELDNNTSEGDIANPNVNTKIEFSTNLSADSAVSKSDVSEYKAITPGTIETNSMPKAPLVNFCMACASS
jgi:hypothetical protein